MMCTYGFSQTIDYNTKNGYAVQGYDVVSYFDKTPLELEFKNESKTYWIPRQPPGPEPKKMRRQF